MKLPIAAGLATISLAACSTPPSGHTTTTHDGAYLVRWNTTGGHAIELDEYFAIRAKVSPQAERVRIDALMPSHRHGMVNDATMQHEADGHWVAADMLFHMPGHWRVRFDITDDNGTVHRAEADVELE